MLHILIRGLASTYYNASCVSPHIVCILHRRLHEFCLYVFHLRKSLLGDYIDIMVCPKPDEGLYGQFETRNP